MALLVGCGAATRMSRLYGQEAVYSEAYHGYVLQRRAASRSAGQSGTLVLLHPITGKKLRCQEQVMEWARALAEALPEKQRDDDLGDALLGPSLYVVTMCALPLAPVGAVPYFAARSTPWQKLSAEGRAANQAGHFGKAATLLERALLKGGHAARRDTTILYELGLAYEQGGQAGRAALAWEAFITESLVQDAAKYADAAQRLRRFSTGTDWTCVSRAPVRIDWERGR